MTTSPRDADAAADVTEWFGKYIADRPAQFIALLGLAQIAERAMGGDSAARQAILDGTVESMIGVSAERAETIAQNTLSVFLSAASGALDGSGQPNPETFAADAVAWAQRWERAQYSQ